MTLEKDPAILDLVSRLRLDDRGWQVVDHWDADLCAIGVAKAEEPRRLVYVSTFAADPGRYDYVCEIPSGPEPTDFVHGDEGDSVDFDRLVAALEAHLA